MALVSEMHQGLITKYAIGFGVVDRNIDLAVDLFPAGINVAGLFAAHFIAIIIGFGPVAMTAGNDHKMLIISIQITGLK